MATADLSAKRDHTRNVRIKQFISIIASVISQRISQARYNRKATNKVSEKNITYVS